LQEIDIIIEQHPEKLIVIYFTSKNCPPCKTISPLYEELSQSEEFDTDTDTDTTTHAPVLFLKVDVDQNPEAVAKYQITGWPTFVFIKHKEVQTEIVGGKLAEATLYDWIKLLMPRKDTKGEDGKEQEEQEEQ
jgi:thioredoxin 1